MVAPMIQIKLKGAKALTVLGKKGGVAALQFQVGPAAKAGAMRLGELEGARAGLGKAAIARGGELEGARAGLGKAGLGKLALARGVEAEGARAGLGKLAMARGGELEGARLVTGTRELGAQHFLGTPKAAGSIGVVIPKSVGPVAKGAAAIKATSAGTLWSGTGMSLGIGIGLGGYGPFLLLGVVGLTATGIYLWQRERAREAELDDLDDFDDFDDDDVEVVEAIS